MKIDKNALTKEQIEAWKTQFGHVYKTVISGEPIIWRKLKRAEYIEVMGMTTDDLETERIYHRQEEIVKKVVVYPENIKDLVEDNCGLATNLAEEVLGKSGFDMTPTEEL